MANSATDAFENGIQLLVFNNTTFAEIGDATGIVGSTGVGSLYVALHTASPGESPANQTVNEVSYTGYSRQAVGRSPGGWTVSGNTVSNTGAISFGECTVGSPLATHFSIASSPGGQVLFQDALTSSLQINPNIDPTFAAGQLQLSVD